MGPLPSPVPARCPLPHLPPPSTQIKDQIWPVEQTIARLQ